MCASLITYPIEVPCKTIKNDRSFTIHITSTVQKILGTCAGKQTIEGVPVELRVPVDYFPLQYSGLFTAPALDV